MTKFEKYFTDRAISPEVRDSRPYIEWTSGDHLREIVAPYMDSLTATQRKAYARQISTIANQSPTGLAITRGVGEIPFHLAEAQRLLHEAVGHDFGIGEALSTRPTWGVRLPELKPFTDVYLDRREPWTYHGTAQPSYRKNSKGRWCPCVQDEHGDWHTMARDNVKRDFLMEQHIRKHHAGVNIEHAHRHDAEAAKYIFPQGEGLAAHLDVHPWALELLPMAHRVYWIMEGCPKADSVLTWIIAHSEAASVVSSASITLWDAAELAYFVRKYLLGIAGGPQVVLVPDDDYHSNPDVIKQALILRTALRDLGLADVIIAAPPVGNGRKGVDEYLGPVRDGKQKGGGSMHGLLRFEREAPEALGPNGAWKIAAGLTPPDGRKPRADGVERDRVVLHALSLHTGLDGVYRGTLEGLARLAHLGRMSVDRALTNLTLRGDVTVDKTPVLHTEPMRDWRGNLILNDKTGEPIIPLEWIDPPTITVAKQYRRTNPDNTTRPLGGIMNLSAATPATRDDIWRLEAKINTLLDRGDRAIEDELQQLLEEEGGEA